MPFHEANIHVYDNDVYYGDGVVMEAIAPVGSILYYDKGDLSHFFFQNVVPGSVGRVIAVATVVHPETRAQLQRVV